MKLSYEKFLQLPFEAAQMLKPMRDLFSLGLRQTDRDLLRVDECEFLTREWSEKAWRFTGCGRVPSLTVTLHPRTVAGTLFWGFEVAGIPEDCALEWLEPLRLRVANPHGDLLLTHHEGEIVRDPMWEGFQPKEPGWHNYQFFPGYDQMQFIAYFADDRGFCCIARDPACGVKFFNARKDDAHLELYCRIYCGGEFGADYASSYELSLESCAPNWMSACAHYRDYLEQSGFDAPKGNFSKIVTESPVVAIYPVRGRGDDRGAMDYNEYFPYTNALPVLDRLGDQLDSKMLALLMHWEGTAPWAPPYVWPPQGGEEALAKFRDALHSRGNYLGVYCSGTGWTQQSCIDWDYRPADKCAEEHREVSMAVAPDGKAMDSLICTGIYSQRLGYDLCMGDDWARQTIIDEVGKLANFGLDYAQFYDQNIGGAAYLCWSRQHQHAPVPGPDQVANQANLLQELKDRYPDLLLGAESSAAEPYIKYLPFSDMRYSCWDMQDAHPVPAYSFIYHEYVNNFMGNHGGMQFYLDLDKSPENLLWRTAFAFASGNLLSVILGEGGSLLWGWICPWGKTSLPDQDSEITLIRNLNRCRKTFPQFLIYGRMLEPLHKVTGPKWSLAIQGRFPREIDAFIATWWQSPDGSRALILTNFRPVAQTVEVDGRPVTLPPLDAVVLPC